MPDLEHYETTEEVRRRLGLKSRRLIQRWCENGALPCIKVGHIWLVEKDAMPNVVRRSGKKNKNES